MGPSGRIGYILDYIALFGTGYAGFRQVLYLGRAPRTKETLPDFREKFRVTRHSRVFRGLTGSQRTPGFGASHPQRILAQTNPLTQRGAYEGGFSFNGGPGDIMNIMQPLAEDNDNRGQQILQLVM